MNDNIDVERRIATWIDDQFAEREPGDLLSRVLDTTSQRRPRPAWLGRLNGHHLSSTSPLAGINPTPQRRSSWPARRSPQMSTSIRTAMAAAALVVLVLISVNLVTRTVGYGGQPTSPAPTASSTPTPSTTAAPTLPSGAPTLPSGQIAPGTYQFGMVTFTLPAGWTSLGVPTSLYQDSGGYLIVKPDAMPPKGMAVDLWQIAMVYKDPCHWIGTAASVGPTVDDLVAALGAQKGRSTPTPVDVTIDGFFGKQIDLMVPLAVKIASCDGGEYLSWIDANRGYRYNQGPGQHDLLDILDVNGQTLVIQRSFYPANTAADRAELQAIVDSITITP